MRDYTRHRQKAATRSRMMSTQGRELGPLPPVEDPARRAAAARDLAFFCRAYFPDIFHLPWSEDHLKVIRKLETCILKGGLFAVAMPRGSGKTSLCKAACLWAILYGYREFVALIGSSEGHATNMLRDLKIQLETNTRLKEDFPEVCHPIAALEGIANRCKGQLYQGKRTFIEWTADRIVLPTIPGSAAAGAILTVAGITGQIRGMSHQRPDGRIVRPSLVILDDPQTDESAHSPSQCAAREATIAGAVLGLGGPGEKIAAIMPCTVIRPGDLADTFLNTEKHPEWNGERLKLIYAFPTRKDLWAEYGQVLAEGLRAGKGIAPATEFYRVRRAEMDEGAVVAWPERFHHDELSAIQHAMNLLLQNEQAFWAEYQNEPLPEESVEEEDLSADQIASKLNRMRRGEVPIGCNHLTMFIDVQQNLLFFVVAAWEDDFTGYVIDYGTYPKQDRPYFTLRDARRTLAMVTGVAGVEGAIYAGLEKLTTDYLGREFRRADGALLRIERCLVDANWGQSTDVVYQFCRQSAHAAVLMPSHGRFIGASSRPLNDYQRKPGDRVGFNWRIPNVQGRRAVRYCVYDTNFWKSFVYARLAVAMGDRGCLSLFGDRPEQHRLFAEHLTAEYRVRTEGRGRTVDEWKLRVSGGDNHWLDCLVGCAVAASLQGVALPGMAPEPGQDRRRVSFAELQRRRRNR